MEPRKRKVKRICFQSLKYPSKNVIKRKVGYSYYSIQIILMTKLIKNTETFVAALDEC